MNSKFFTRLIAVVLLSMSGCNVTWPMLSQSALISPIEAVEGRGVVYAPPSATIALTAEQVAVAPLDQLLNYYAPVLVQGQGSGPGDKHPWPIEADSIGRAYLSYNEKGKLVTQIDISQPTVYAFGKRIRPGREEHIQLTYLVWYPRHPRTKLIDIESAPIDSGVIRITLDNRQQPMLYETVLACGCYHKVFAEAWVESASQQAYGPPVEGKHYSLERKTPFKLDWEVAGVVNTPHQDPTRPTIFVSAGEHRNIGLHSSATFHWPIGNDSVRQYRLASYQELLAVPIAGTTQTASIFNPQNDQQVLGADRLEKYIFMWIGTDDAGHPRRDDEILLHFDQSEWSDPTNYERYLRLPPGLF